VTGDHPDTLPDPRPEGVPSEAFPQLREVRISGESIFEGRLLHVHRDRARTPDGQELSFEYTLHPGAAVVVPRLPDGRLVLERQWRYAMNRSFLEFPAGKLHAGEDPVKAIQRELAEETGYRARRWARLGEMHPVIGYSTEVIHLFLAEDLTPGPTAREPGECLEIELIEPGKFFDLIRQGQVTDSKTLSCAIWLDRYLRGEWSVSWLAD
jgi:ADP-ribose pyrophosphatase